jgi:hypothetical protein
MRAMVGMVLVLIGMGSMLQGCLLLAVGAGGRCWCSYGCLR